MTEKIKSAQCKPVEAEKPEQLSDDSIEVSTGAGSPRCGWRCYKCNYSLPNFSWHCRNCGAPRA